MYLSMREILENRHPAGRQGPFTEALCPILSNDHIFGVNLYEAGLGALCEGYFEELVAGPGAVRATLAKYID